jgi:hypothetical protein
MKIPVVKITKHWRLLPLILIAGCIAPSTVLTRQRERPAAYAALSPETRALVDQGRIRVGMDTNAVYIAWGQPGEVTEGENQSGRTTSWTYYDSYLQELRVWGWHRMYYDYYPINYISAQVTFTNSIVKQWQTYPAPGY